MTAAETMWSGGLPEEADLMLQDPPAEPFDWIREGTSIWYFEENGDFAIPRIGIEAEPWTWENRRFGGNLAFRDGRVLCCSGQGPMRPVLDSNGRRAIMGGGPISFRCIKPFKRWHVEFDGLMIDTTVKDQIASTVDASRKTHVHYELELEMAAPADSQDITPARFSKLGKGKQRDAVSIGLGWRFTQLLRGDGELKIDGSSYAFPGTGMRVKRRSIRTDALMLRGHIWQGALFPDGKGFGFEVRPVHSEGFEPWNEGYLYQNGTVYPAKVENPSWLGDIISTDEDVSFDLRSELGVTHIRAKTAINTFMIMSGEVWGLNLQQGSVLYEWDDVEGYGMIERSAVTTQSNTLEER